MRRFHDVSDEVTGILTSRSDIELLMTTMHVLLPLERAKA
jgi:hypothetical protein